MVGPRRRRTKRNCILFRSENQRCVYVCTIIIICGIATVDFIFHLKIFAILLPNRIRKTIKHASMVARCRLYLSNRQITTSKIEMSFVMFYFYFILAFGLIFFVKFRCRMALVANPTDEFLRGKIESFFHVVFDRDRDG